MLATCNHIDQSMLKDDPTIFLYLASNLGESHWHCECTLNQKAIETETIERARYPGAALNGSRRASWRPCSQRSDRFRQSLAACPC